MGYSNTVTYSLLVEGLFWFDLVFSLKFVCCFIIQHFSFLIDFYYFNYMCVHVCGFVYMNAVPEEVRRTCRIPWGQSYRKL